MSDTIKYILEALRSGAGQKPGVYRQAGYPARRVRGSMDPVGNTARDVGYSKYVNQQKAMDESPVSYEEWLKQ